MRSRLIACTLWLIPVTANSQPAATGNTAAYPDKPIRMLAAAAGGGSDFGARLVAQELGSSLGQRVVVDNRGVVAAEMAAKAPPDGYTLLFSGSALWLTPLLRSSAGYDAIADFAPITLINIQPQILIVHPSLPVQSVKELISLAKVRPGELDYASGPAGSTGHLAGELFKAMAGVNIVRIPFQGNGPVTTAVLGGQVPLTFGTAGAVASHFKSGQLRALAVTSAQPTALLPGVPTVAASGLPGYESVTIMGVLGPARTPAAIIDKLHQEINRVLGQSAVREKFLNSGAETVGASPREFAAIIRSDAAKWSKVVKDAGIRAE